MDILSPLLLSPPFPGPVAVTPPAAWGAWPSAPAPAPAPADPFARDPSASNLVN